MSGTTGTGTFVCPLCGSTVRFTVEVEVDPTTDRFHSSRARHVPDDHAADCRGVA